MTEHSGYDDLTNHRRRAADALSTVGKAAGELGLHTRAGHMSAMARLLDQDVLRVMFLGGFDAGKSTLINALLGDRVLPASYTPTTGLITIVRWGPEQLAWLFPRPTREVPDPAPQLVPFDELADYLVIAEEETGASPYVRAEVELPAAICTAGVELADSPGLDDATENREVRANLTIDYLPHADIVVFVTRTVGAMGDKERGFIRDVVCPLGHQDLFVVCSRIDDLPVADRAVTTRKIIRSLADLAPPERIFFVNSLGGLEARRAGDETGLTESGIPAFEQALERFLVAERGRTKVIRAVRGVEQLIDELADSVESRRQSLTKDAKETRDRCAQIREIVPVLQRQRAGILATVDTYLGRIEIEVQASAVRFLAQAADRCADWLNDLPDLDRNWRDILKIRTRVKASANATAQHLGDHLQHAVAEWQQREITELLAKRAAELQTAIDGELVEFVALAGQALRVLEGSGEPAAAEKMRLIEERFADFVPPDLLGHFDMPEPRYFLTPVMRRIAVFIAASIFSQTALLRAGLPGLLAAVFVSFGGRRLEKKVSTLVAGELAAYIRGQATVWGAAIRTSTAVELATVSAGIRDGIEVKIADLEEQVGSITAALDGDIVAVTAQLDAISADLEVQRDVVARICAEL